MSVAIGVLGLLEASQMIICLGLVCACSKQAEIEKATSEMLHSSGIRSRRMAARGTHEQPGYYDDGRDPPGGPPVPGTTNF